MMSGAETKSDLGNDELSRERGLSPLSTAMSAALAAAVFVWALGFAILYPSAQTTEPLESPPMELIGP